MKPDRSKLSILVVPEDFDEHFLEILAIEAVHEDMDLMHRGLYNEEGMKASFEERAGIPLWRVLNKYNMGDADIRMKFGSEQEASEAYEHIRRNSRYGQLWSHLETIHSRETKHAKNPKAREIRKKCNVCGAVFCYTLSDLEKNLGNAVSNLAGSILQVGGAATGNTGAAIYGRLAQNQIADYTRCPNCHSTDLSDWNQGEAPSQAAQTEAAATNDCAPAVSGADEISKYHDLLEKGIITREEFDAKKKQILGLQ